MGEGTALIGTADWGVKGGVAPFASTIDGTR